MATNAYASEHTIHFYDRDRTLYGFHLSMSTAEANVQVFPSPTDQNDFVAAVATLLGQQPPAGAIVVDHTAYQLAAATALAQWGSTRDDKALGQAARAELLHELAHPARDTEVLLLALVFLAQRWAFDGPDRRQRNNAGLQHLRDTPPVAGEREVQQPTAEEQDKHVCDNCCARWAEDDLSQIRAYFERTDPGGTVPSGECPDCGALCYPEPPASTRNVAAAGSPGRPTPERSPAMPKDTTIQVQPDGPWRAYWGAPPLPTGFQAMGTVRRNDVDTGALLRNDAGLLVQGNAGSIRSLPQREAKAALERAIAERPLALLALQQSPPIER